MNTGKMYNSEEEASLDGVDKSNLIRITKDLQFYAKQINPKYPNIHQSSREMSRRIRQLEKV